jgi:hypothetical protein
VAFRDPAVQAGSVGDHLVHLNTFSQDSGAGYVFALAGVKSGSHPSDGLDQDKV